MLHLIWHLQFQRCTTYDLEIPSLQLSKCVPALTSFIFTSTPHYFQQAFQPT